MRFRDVFKCICPDPKVQSICACATSSLQCRCSVAAQHPTLVHLEVKATHALEKEIQHNMPACLKSCSNSAPLPKDQSAQHIVCLLSEHTPHLSNEVSTVQPCVHTVFKYTWCQRKEWPKYFDLPPIVWYLPDALHQRHVSFIQPTSALTAC